MVQFHIRRILSMSMYVYTCVWSDAQSVWCVYLHRKWPSYWCKVQPKPITKICHNRGPIASCMHSSQLDPPRKGQVLSNMILVYAQLISKLCYHWCDNLYTPLRLPGLGGVVIALDICVWWPTSDRTNIYIIYIYINHIYVIYICVHQMCCISKVWCRGKHDRLSRSACAR